MEGRKIVPDRLQTETVKAVTASMSPDEPLMDLAVWINFCSWTDAGNRGAAVINYWPRRETPPAAAATQRENIQRKMKALHDSC